MELICNYIPQKKKIDMITYPCHNFIAALPRKLYSEAKPSTLHNYCLAPNTDQAVISTNAEPLFTVKQNFLDMFVSTIKSFHFVVLSNAC